MLLAAALGPGCAAPRGNTTFASLPGTAPDPAAVARARALLAHLYPPQYRATQRAIITVGGKQFVCDGVLQVSPGQGHHLALVSTLGFVTDLRVTPDGATEVLKVTALMPEAWSRNYVARDLARLFVPGPTPGGSGVLPDGRLVLEGGPDADAVVARHVFSRSGERLEELELSRQGKRVYHAVVRRWQKFAGYPAEVPSEFAVVAPGYRLDLRTAALELTAP